MHRQTHSPGPLDDPPDDDPLRDLFDRIEPPDPPPLEPAVQGPAGWAAAWRVPPVLPYARPANPATIPAPTVRTWNASMPQKRNRLTLTWNRVVEVSADLGLEALGLEDGEALCVDSRMRFRCVQCSATFTQRFDNLKRIGIAHSCRGRLTIDGQIPFELIPTPVDYAAEPVYRPAILSRELLSPAAVVASLFGSLRPDPVVSNILCTCHLGIKVDTYQVAQRLWNAEYRPPGSLTLRCPRRRLTVAVDRSGKVSCVGARTIPEARREMRRCCRLIQRSLRDDPLPGQMRHHAFPLRLFTYRKARFLGFRVVNIKAEWELGYSLDLHSFREQCGNQFEIYYDPEVFPALKLSLTEPKMAMQIFPNGTVGIIGASSLADITFACKEVLDRLARPYCLHSLPS